MLLDIKNNFVGTLKIMSNAKNFDILATDLSVLHNFIVQQNYFSSLYPAKIQIFQQNLFPVDLALSHNSRHKMCDIK